MPVDTVNNTCEYEFFGRLGFTGLAFKADRVWDWVQTPNIGTCNTAGTSESEGTRRFP